jgi:hypothetical protein
MEDNLSVAGINPLDQRESFLNRRLAKVGIPAVGGAGS